MTTQFLKFGSLAAMALSIPFSSFADEPIMDAEGTVITFNKTFKSFDSTMMLTEDNTEEGAEIVFDGNGNVYFFNLTACQYGGRGDTYIKGVQEGNKIYVDTPSLNFIQDMGQTEVNYVLHSLVTTDEIPMMPTIMGITTWYCQAAEPSRIVFNISDDGVISYDNNGGLNAFGNCTVPNMSAFEYEFDTAMLDMVFTPDAGQDLIYINQTTAPEEPIMEAEGTSIFFNKTFKSFDSTMLLTEDNTEEGAEIVFDGKGNVYFFNLTACQYGGRGDTYIKGVQQGYKIYVDTPSINFIQDMGQTEVHYILHSLVTTDEIPMMPSIMGIPTWYCQAPEPARIVFNISEEGVISYDNNGGLNAFGNCTVPNMSAFEYEFDTAMLDMVFSPEEGQDLIYLPVNAVDGIASELKNVTYFDLNGRAVSKPVAGSICIKSETFSDGSVRNTKVIVK